MASFREAPVLVETAPSSRPFASAASPATVYARVAVYRDVTAPLLAAWEELEQSAVCSIYQTRAWLLPWIETLGHRAGIKPLFVLAFDADDRCLALLALGIVRRGPLRVACWLGGRDSNFNMPLMRGGCAFTRQTLVRLLSDIARVCAPEKLDMFALQNQPFAWADHPNPLALLPHQPAPSAAYGTALSGNGELLFATKLSKDTRKKLRKKEARLASLGPLTHLVVETCEQQGRVIDALIAQKVARFREKNIVSEFDTAEMRRFIEKSARPAGNGIELHALCVGDRIAAVYGGAAHAGEWSGMFNAFDGDEEIARSSPGDLLLMRIVAKACADGLQRLDLGIGEARYKTALCDEQIPLFDVFFATSPLGSLVARGMAARQLAKRAIKRSPRLFALVKRLRAMAR